MALAWTLQDGRRAERLLALTGMDADHLRENANNPDVLAALLRFLESHEPDLIACAEAMECTPQDLVDARRSLESEGSMR